MHIFSRQQTFTTILFIFFLFLIGKVEKIHICVFYMTVTRKNFEISGKFFQFSKIQLFVYLTCIYGVIPLITTISLFKSYFTPRNVIIITFCPSVVVPCQASLCRSPPWVGVRFTPGCSESYRWLLRSLSNDKKHMHTSLWLICA